MTVSIRIDGHRATLCLQRPEVLNAMNWEVFDGLARAADEITGARDVRVVVVTGEGRAFSSGLDTSALGDVQGAPVEMVARAQAGFRKLAALKVPVIAAVKGHALGAGLQLALVCDVRVVARDARIGLLEARYGLIPDLGGTQRLPLLVGPGRAMKMMWLAELIDGEEAGRIGLAEVVVEDEELGAATDELAQRIEAAPPIAVREVKRLVRLAGSLPLAAGMDEEARSQLDTLASRDLIEAVAAFVAKRSPIFRGE